MWFRVVCDAVWMVYGWCGWCGCYVDGVDGVDAIWMVWMVYGVWIQYNSYCRHERLGYHELL